MTVGPPIVEVRGVSKRFTMHRETSIKERLLGAVRRESHAEEFWALRDIELEIAAGTTVGLIGPNGSGKSTLLKVIGAIIQPTTGTVRRRGRLAALLELGAGFHQDLTGRENIYLNAAILGMSQAETARQFDAIVEFSGIEPFIDTQVKFYSSGMYVRLAFAVAVHVDPDLLLVDEVLAVGDEPFQRKCMDKIRSFQAEGRTIVLVSHSAEQVGEMCDRVLLLRSGRVAYDGAPADALRRLRAGFEADREAELVAHEETGPHATITSVEVLDAGGSPVTSVATGDTVTVRVNVDPVQWFLNARDDTRSSWYLEDAATEYQIQGLELDWIVVTWDADLLELFQVPRQILPEIRSSSEVYGTTKNVLARSVSRQAGNSSASNPLRPSRMAKK